MNKMKRTLAAALGCILAISGLTACGSSQSDGTETLEYIGAPATGTPQRKAIEKLSRNSRRPIRASTSNW